MKFFFPIGILTVMLSVLASCSPLVDTRGHNTASDDFSQIIEGQSGKEDVQAILGTPSSRSNFGDETWYYISNTKERIGIFASEVTEQQVTAVQFNAEGRVAGIERYKKEDGKPVVLVNKETTTEGQKLTFIEQMLGNLGRFNAPGPGNRNSARDAQRR